jgi:hypothetical protein
LNETLVRVCFGQPKSGPVRAETMYGHRRVSLATILLHPRCRVATASLNQPAVKQLMDTQLLHLSVAFYGRRHFTGWHVTFKCILSDPISGQIS